jgi:hypothetical protein
MNPYYFVKVQRVCKERILGLASRVTSRDPETSRLATSCHRKVSLRNATGISHSKQLSYTRASELRVRLVLALAKSFDLTLISSLFVNPISSQAAWIGLPVYKETLPERQCKL